VVRRGVRKERNWTRRGHCGQERSKEGKEQDQERPLWSGEVSGGTRKELYRIR
jgi:hypothetical protein